MFPANRQLPVDNKRNRGKSSGVIDDITFRYRIPLPPFRNIKRK